MNIYEKLVNTTKFVSFWLSLSVTVLAVVIGLNSNYLSPYVDSEYNWFNPIDIIQFPSDQLLESEGIRDFDIIGHSIVPNDSIKYHIIVDKSNSIQKETLSKDLKKDLSKYLKGKFLSEEITEKDYSHLQNRDLLALAIGCKIRSLGIDDNNINVNYYLDSKYGELQFYKGDKISKGSPWFEKIINANTVQPNEDTDSESQMANLILDIYKKLEKEQEFYHIVVFLSDFQVVKNSPNWDFKKSITELQQKLSENRQPSNFITQFNMIKLQSKNKNSKGGFTFDEVLKSQFEQTYIQYLGEKDLENTIKNLNKEYMYLNSFLCLNQPINEKKYIPVNEIIIESSLRTLSTEYTARVRNKKGQTEIIDPLNQIDEIFYQGNYKDIECINGVCYKLDNNKSAKIIFNPPHQNLNKKSYLDVYFKKEKIKNRYYLKFRPLMPALSTKIWLFLLVSILTLCLIYFASICTISIKHYKKLKTQNIKPTALLYIIFILSAVAILGVLYLLGYEIIYKFVYSNYLSIFLIPFVFFTLGGLYNLKYDYDSYVI